MMMSQDISGRKVDAIYTHFLESALQTQDLTVYPLAGDASTRRYFRVHYKDQTWVLMCWEPFSPENYPFLSVLKHLKKNKVGVPEVFDLSPYEGFVLLEDLGDLTLERKFWEQQDQETVLPFYELAIDELIKIHYGATADHSSCTAFTTFFDREKFLWEMNYGRKHLLEGLCQLKLSEASQREIQSIFIDICTKLDSQEKRIAHRDYHSRNLMIKKGQMRVIDFQDARMGPVQYDLVSLVKDSYVQLNSAITQKILNYYLEQRRELKQPDLSLEEFNNIFEIQLIQRCFKACGSFSSFFNLRDDTRYLKYISHTLKTVMKSLSGFPEYRLFSDVLFDSGALEKNYESLKSRANN